MFGNTEAVVLATRGILSDIHTNPGHQLPWMGETLHVSDFGNHGQGKEILDAFVTGQGLNRLFVPRCVCHDFCLLAVLSQKRC